MKKIFTLMLTFACALFAGVSCTAPDDGSAGNFDWSNANVKGPFAVKFYNATAQSVSCVCKSSDSNMMFVMLSTDDLANLEQFGVTGNTPESKMNSFLQYSVTYETLSPTEPDGYLLCKGVSDLKYPKETYRVSDYTVDLYVVGVKFTYDDAESMYTYEMLTDVCVFPMPFLPYPSVSVFSGDLTQNLPCTAGSVSFDMELENPVEGASWNYKDVPAWATVEWADNKLTVSYDANNNPVGRSVVVDVQYGENGVYGSWALTLNQAKDENAPDVTFEFANVEPHFYGFKVDVIPSDKNAKYIVASSIYDANTDWEVQANRQVGYYDVAYHTGDLLGYIVNLNPRNYEWVGYDYSLYAFAIETEVKNGTSQDGTAWTREYVTAILSSVSHTEKVTVTTDDMPGIDWVVEGSKLVWSDDKDRYELEVKAGETVVLKYTITNAVEGGVLKLNGGKLEDSYGIIDGEPVIDNEAQTITFVIDDYDTSKKYHYEEMTFNYTNEAGDSWGVMTPRLRVTQVQ